MLIRSVVHLLQYLILIFCQRENALLELSKKREIFPDLAPVLWHSFGTIAALIQEILSIYPMLSPPTLTPHASNRVCNALALLQCVASHPETKSKLMNGSYRFSVMLIALSISSPQLIFHYICIHFSTQSQDNVHLNIFVSLHLV
jgi:hypothetical protein